ncbi:MAG: hypothetical protein KF830_00955 [Planctomycetes bacterium]|nr:hypothetical protein [Planctomycetota bacterium]
MLTRPGPDGREAREAAIVRLLRGSDPAAHRLLHEQLQRREDPDRVRESILAAFEHHVLGDPAEWFGGANEEARRQLLAGHLEALAPLWRDAPPANDDGIDNPVRAAARRCLQRVPVRELDAAARLLLAGGAVAVRIDVLRCLADMQQMLLAPTIADGLEAPEEPVRAQARRSLQLLTYHDEEFQTKAQFLLWQERFGGLRYVDLAERAARLGPRPLEKMRAELARLRVDAAREFVRAHTVRTPGIDWAAVQARTMVDDPAVLDACLELLQQALASGLPGDDQALPRQAFCRAALQRFRQVSGDQPRRRALLLEVASYLCRHDEGELAAEVTTLLLVQIEAPERELQLAALRGLRRFPTLETRARLVRHALAMLRRGAEAREPLLTTLGTLAFRGTPRWLAPNTNDPDKGDWLALVEAACRAAADAEVRAAGLTLAQTLDGREQRVPELFGILLAMVRDTAQESKFRATCLIQLRGWRHQEGAAEEWVQALHELLRDPADDLRLQAVDSLVRLPELVDVRRLDWIRDTITVLRDRIRSEANPAVLRAMVNCLLVCGRESAVSANAIGALNVLLSELASAPPAEKDLRVEPLLQALATIAAGPHAERGLWISACRQLLSFEKRQSLRLVLQSHGAADLAKLVGSDDAPTADAARQAMRLLIRTAVLKPAKEPWNGSEELLLEARDVRLAFSALDTVDEGQRLDAPAHRLLRLEVELAAGKFAEVAQRAGLWLANGTTDRSVMEAADRDRMRALAAEAQLGLGKAEAAARLLADLAVQPPVDPAILDLHGRVARALVAADRSTAVALLARAWRATPPEDPAFRSRLLEWMQHQSRLEAGAQQVVVQESEPFVALFAAADCPSEQREMFHQLRNRN